MLSYTYDSPEKRIRNYGYATYTIEGYFNTKEEAKEKAKQLKKDYKPTKIYISISEVKEDEI